MSDTFVTPAAFSKNGTLQNRTTKTSKRAIFSKSSVDPGDEPTPETQPQPEPEQVTIVHHNVPDALMFGVVLS